MYRLNRTIAAIVSALGWVSLMGFAVSGVSAASRPSIQLKTQPPIQQAIPFTEPVQLTLRVLDNQGQAIKNAKLHLQIRTPSPTPWFTTDFPIVEGTTLLKLETIAPEGTLNLRQVFPIRGTYQFVVSATPINAGSFTPIQQTLNVTVPENPVKYRNLFILVVLLLGVGWCGGRIIGRQHSLQEGEIAPQPVRLLLSGAVGVAILSLLVINISAERSESHNHEPVSEAQDHPHHTNLSTASSSDLHLKLGGDQTATVGQLANIFVEATHAKNEQFPKNVLFKIKTTQLEDQDVTFETEISAQPFSKLNWQQQFFDGAPHAIDVSMEPQPDTSPQFQPIRISRTIEVEGVAPPLSTRLISLIYFTSVVGVGFGGGLWQSRRKVVPANST